MVNWFKDSHPKQRDWSDTKVLKTMEESETFMLNPKKKAKAKEDQARAPAQVMQEMADWDKTDQKDAELSPKDLQAKMGEMRDMVDNPRKYADRMVYHDDNPDADDADGVDEESPADRRADADANALDDQRYEAETRSSKIYSHDELAARTGSTRSGRTTTRPTTGRSTARATARSTAR